MTRYLFLRHAEAGPHRVDHERPLTEQGIAQAERLQIDYPCDLIITSTAKRTVQTANIIRRRLYPHAAVEHIKALYMPPSKEDVHSILQLLQENKGANLAQLLNQDREGAWERYAEEAAVALETLKVKYGAENLLIVAHAIIINDVALRIDPGAEELRSLFFAPCTGFLLEPVHPIQYIC